MTLQNLALLVEIALGGTSLSSYSAIITDSAGNNHNVSAFPLVNGVNGQLVFFDSSGSTYTASSLTVQVNGTTVLTETLSITKGPNDVLAVLVNITGVSQDNFATFLSKSLILLLGGESPPYTMSLSLQYTVVNYATTTVSGTTVCTNSVSSTSSGSAGPSSYTQNGNTLAVNFSIGYGSCQEIVVNQLVANTPGGQAIYPAPSGTASTQCGYNASCTYTLTINIAV